MNSEFLDSNTCKTNQALPEGAILDVTDAVMFVRNDGLGDLASDVDIPFTLEPHKDLEVYKIDGSWRWRSKGGFTNAFSEAFSTWGLAVLDACKFHNLPLVQNNKRYYVVEEDVYQNLKKQGECVMDVFGWRVWGKEQ